MRLKTIKLLGEFKDKRTIDILKYKRDHDPSLRVQNAAKSVLEKIHAEAKKENRQKPEKINKINNEKRDNIKKQ